MSDLVDAVRERWGAPVASAPPPAAVPAGVPDELVTLWHEVGLAGFGDGRLWLVDPTAWQPAVDAWADGEEGWRCLARTAFGTTADTVYAGRRGGVGPALDDLSLRPAVDHVTALAATTPRTHFPDLTA